MSGPIVHDNLAIYFVHGQSAAGPVPLTLDEALAKGAVKVHETGSVNELAIENLIVEKMNKLSPAQYEAILRPVFKDDEMLMITVGAVLGFLVGELQVVLVEQFAR